MDVTRIAVNPLDVRREGAKRIQLVRRSAILLALLCLVMACPSDLSAQSQWPDQRRVGPILYHANFSLNPHKELLQEVSVLQAEIPRRLRLQPARNQVHVYLFSDQGIYEKYMRHHFPGVPHRRALFIKERGPGMVFAYRSDELAVDLRHEATHAILHSFLPMVPLWLDEGLAEYFEVEAGDRYGQNPHLRSVRWRMRLRQIPELQRLEQLGELSDMSRDDYRDAWAWIHFLLHGPEEVRSELRRYLTDIQSQIPPGRLSDRLQRRAPDVNRRFIEHFK